MTKQQLFIVSHEDWSLHRKGYTDQARHQQRVREAIKKNLPDLVSDESIIMSDGRKTVKVPIKSLDEAHFIYNFNKKQHVGQGDGDSQVGDVIGVDSQMSKRGDKGGEAGDQPGEDIFDTEISIDDLETILFDEMELPNLEEKPKQVMQTTEIVFNDIRKKGIMSNLDKKKTLLEHIRRHAKAGSKELGAISPDDLRYKTWQEIVKPRSNAVIFALMDTSGSMGAFEKYCARSAFFWMNRFLKKKYEHVEIVYLAHHTEAKEVTEEEFFTRGESGGTICSSVYQKTLDIIEEKYSPDEWNIYPFHFSDGDNLTSDNERCVKLIEQLMSVCNMFCYGEVNQYNRNSTLMNAYKHIGNKKFRYSIIKEKGEVYKALTHFFSKTVETAN